MKEIKSLRKKREKHFLNNDGSITAYLYDKDIHFLKDGKYEEINNNLISRGTYFENKNNYFKVKFLKNNIKQLVNLKKDNYYLNMYLDENNINKLNIKRNNNVAYYNNIINNVDIKYEIINSKVKESIVLNNRDDKFGKLNFIIKTNLLLEKVNNEIIAKSLNEKIFTIEKPYMVDKNNNYNDNLEYIIKKNKNDYILTLNLDNKWLKNKNTIYPITIDPTIIVNENSNIFDTYIYENDTNVDRNNSDKLKVGVDGNNKVYRTLLKFDLPTIGTGCSVVNASFTLTSHKDDYVTGTTPIDSDYLLSAHKINSSWNEQTACWENMHDKYDERVEDFIIGTRTRRDLEGGVIYNLSSNTFNITNLVRKWYSGEPNYGIMIKKYNEIYEEERKESLYYSKSHNVTTVDPKPFLTVTYKNKNGLESYMSYEQINFKGISSYVNRFTGNLTNVINLSTTPTGRFPASLSVIYNTNDVILNNNYGYKVGYKLNYHQLLKELTIEETDYVEYLDEDGTLHYFLNVNNELIDEDGLGLKLLKENDIYTMKDKDNNKMIFRKRDNLWYLEEIINSSNNKVMVNYDTNNRIIKIIDADNNEINVVYNSNNMVISSNVLTTTLNYTNDLLTSINNKYGTIHITYNSNNIIEKITDIDNKSIKYEYYDVIPYKIKKLTELGLNNEEGKYLNFKYGFDVTSIVNNKGLHKTYTFNENGNEESVTNLTEEEQLNDGYGASASYLSNIAIQYDEYKKLNNKLSGNVDMVKYVKNYLNNSSFEESDTIFETDNETVLISNTYANTGSKSLKIISNNFKNLHYEIEVLKGMDYTFSLYSKNNIPFKISLSYVNELNEVVKETQSIEENELFERNDVTINYPTTSLSNLCIDITLEQSGEIYIDDLQLEEGKIANYHNLIDNSDFSNGLSTWEYEKSNTPDIVTLENGIKVCRILSYPKLSGGIRKTLNISGKQGDSYNLSFWYKNRGINSTVNGNSIYAFVSFVPTEKTFGSYEPALCELKINNDVYQYFSTKFNATCEYRKIIIEILDMNNVNDLFVTNFSLFKDLGSLSFNYDMNGNIVSTTNNSNNQSIFNYDKNNQLINMFNPKGDNFKFEYDNNVQDRVLRAISPTGIVNEVVYDEFDNPIKTVIKNTYFDKETPNGKYYIRLKGTNKYVNILRKTLNLKENTCSHDKFIILKQENSYKLKPIVLCNYYLVNNNDILDLSETDNNNLFELIELNDGSYALKNMNKYLYNDDNNLKFKEVLASELENDNSIKFFIENSENKLFIESNAIYKNEGKVIEKTIDSLYNETKYDINPINNLTNKIIDSSNVETNYIYNSKDQLVKVTKDKSLVNYSYNDNNLLSKISTNNKEYNFIYNNFLKMKQVKIKNNVLITNNYDINNGNLLSVNYGNNNNVNYNYDDLNRMLKTTTMNDTYTYYYNNLGNISKIISNNNLYKYNYDFARRLINYRFDDFKIKYKYDENNNIKEKKYKYFDQYTMNFTYNKENGLTKTNIDTNNINYSYDYLGRLVEKNINDNYKINYKYVTNGNKTSLIVNEIKINNDIYKYHYDKLYNITSINKNDKIINEYKYNKNNELVKDINYLVNRESRYIYDNEGNILRKDLYAIGNNKLISSNIYTYDNDYKDKLIKFNDENITYDNIGNPLSIGNKTLTWINGRELNSYTDNNLNVNYKYNKDGIRISKMVNGLETKYLVENNKIIFENKSGHVLYYIRDNQGNLEGIKYNNEIYYYIKNISNDITGILNNNLEQIVFYEYDSYGNIISIKDTNGNEITDSNNIGIINPYRYKGYYYDTETNLYYLNTRYYSPVFGRFINADGYLSTGTSIIGNNMYAYCDNNPINNVDEDGTLAFAPALPWIGKALVDIISIVTVAIIATIAALGVGTVTESLVSKAWEPNTKEEEPRNQTVYELLDKNNQVQYVGRTKNISTRLQAHRRNPYRSELVFKIYKSGLTYNEARGVEHRLIIQEKTLNRANKMNNQINGIRWDNKKYDIYMKASERFCDIDGCITYVGE